MAKTFTMTKAQLAQWLEDIMIRNYHEGGKPYARFKGDITRFGGLGCCKKYLKSKTLAKKPECWGIVEELSGEDPRFAPLFTAEEPAEAIRRLKIGKKHGAW
jgi:hypothetical protein